MSTVPPGRRLPPVPLLAVGSMTLVIVSGIYLAAYLPRRAPLGLAIGLLGAAWALLAAAAASLAVVGPFAWWAFKRVGGWTLLAYIVIAGMLEYVFVFDGTRGSMLILLTLSLADFALAIPLLFAFSVARYQQPR